MSNPILRLIVAVHLGASRAATRLESSERGQSTAEYALVLGLVVVIVAAAITQKDAFGTFFKAAIDKLTAALH